jgi:hypothetical protein
MYNINFGVVATIKMNDKRLKDVVQLQLCSAWNDEQAISKLEKNIYKFFKSEEIASISYTVTQRSQ